MYHGFKKFSLRENKSQKPRYFIVYQNSRDSENSNKEIIASLVKGSDLILEVNSSLFCGHTPGDEGKVIANLVTDLRDLNLEYRYRQNKIPKKKTILDFFTTENQMATEDQLLFLAPHRMWGMEDLWKVIPPYGVKYYVLKDDDLDGLKLLEDFYNGLYLDEEKEALCQMVIFDCCAFGQMGIETQLTKQELEQLLER